MNPESIFKIFWLAPEAGLIAVFVCCFFFHLTQKNPAAAHLIDGALIGMALVFLSFPLIWTKSGTIFSGMFRLDALAVFLKIIFLTVGFMTLLMVKAFLPSLGRMAADFTLLILLLILGCLFLASSNDLIVLFITIEWITISLYILTAYLREDRLSLEAGTKYLIMGAFSSALFIFGISFVYGGVGSTSFSHIASAVSSGSSDLFLRLGLLLILAGVGFKIAVFPFHWWAPDVYEGSPTPITGFFSVGSKLAGFSALLLVLFAAFRDFGGLTMTNLLAVLSACSLLYGNLGALKQTNIKRLFAYSSIGHAGYILMGIAAYSTLGVQSALFYLAAYGLSNLTAFVIITTVNQSVSSGDMTAYRGLSKRAPGLAAVFFVALLSLGGIPPLIGFMGKFLVIQAALASGLGWLAGVGVLCVVLSLFYYLSIVKEMYAREAETEKSILVPQTTMWILWIAAAVIVLLGVYQKPLFVLVEHASQILQ